VSCTATRAIARLRDVRDKIEIAARPAGGIVVITRDAAESIISDLGIVARCVRELAEGRGE
jgi:hypothetical protein